MERSQWEVSIIDVPYCYGMSEFLAKKIHVLSFGKEIFSHEKQREGVVQWGTWLGASAIRQSARADMLAVAQAGGVKTYRTEFSATPMRDLENSNTFSLHNDIPH
jgi:hypothetical protein